MNKKDKKKFKLGDIIQKLNEAQAASGEHIPAETPSEFVDSPKPGSRVHSFFGPEEIPEETQASQKIFGNENTPANTHGSPSSFSVQMPPAPNVQDRRFYNTESPQVNTPKQVSNNPVPAMPMQHIQNQGFDSPQSENEEPEFDLMRYVGVIFRRRNIIIVCAICMGLFSLFGYVRAVKFYSAHARMLFSPGYQDIMGDNSNAWMVWGRDDQKFNTHLELLKSMTVMQRTAEQLDNKISAGEISGGITIARGESGGEKNDIIDITFKNTDPRMSQTVANQLCKTYIEYMKEVNVQDITRLLMKLEEQIGKVQVELDQKENLLRTFKEKNMAVQLSSETNITVSKLSQLELELQKTQLDILESRERFTGIKKEIGQQNIDVVQSMTYSNPFQAKLAELELELNSLSAEYSPEHFKVKMVKGQIDKIKDAMKTDITKEAGSRTMVKNPIREELLQSLVNLSIEKSALEAKEIAQQQLIKQLDVDLEKLPSLELQFAQLTRETESLVEVQKLLKSRFEEARIKHDSQESDLKILEWAQLPVAGISSVPFTKVLLGFLIGIIIGIALAFGIEFLDQSIKDPQSIERVMELPLLGIVPIIEMEKAIIDSASEKWRTVLEPFRALRATLKHLATAHHLKTFIICSAVKGEGKTTLAANLAITFSLDGKKVILVDGDLRRAQMHSLFNIPKYNGLSDYLLGTRDIEEILKPTVHENLRVITAGEHPDNPSELIGSARFDQLVHELRAMADFIIFDSPALLPVSDGLSMAPKVDACIMVVRALWTPLKAAQQAKNQLKRIGCNIIGGILNGISLSRGYYPYYYGYYRYYAYKYTYEDDQDRPYRTPTLREMGLKIEHAFKTSVKTLVFSFPQFRAKTLVFLGFLARKKTFWLLLSALVLVPLVFSALKFAGVGVNNRDIVYVSKKDTIQYLSPTSTPSAIETIGATHSPIVISDTVAAQSFVASPANTKTQTDQSGQKNKTICVPITASTILLCLKDSISQWESAFNAGHAARFISFYDSLKFKVPGKSFTEWKTGTFALINKPYLERHIAVDTLWPDSIVSPFFQTSFACSLFTVADTVKRIYSLVWQNTNSTWRIIREKYKDQL